MTQTKLQFRIITEGLKFPEGPIAMADGSVLVVEIEGARLIRAEPIERDFVRTQRAAPGQRLLQRQDAGPVAAAAPQRRPPSWQSHLRHSAL